jgi:TonB-linked SusC/RagA family outer membrane protein
MKNNYRIFVIFIIAALLTGLLGNRSLNAQNSIKSLADFHLQGKASMPANGVKDLNNSSGEFATTVKIKKGTYRLGNLINIIASQARLKPSFSRQFVPVNKKVKMPKVRATAKEALNMALKGTALGFKIIDGNQLVFVNKAPNLQQAAQETVTGIVTDAQTNKPLFGVNILVKGTGIGTATDQKGHYSLMVPSLQDTLRFTFIGFKKAVVPINGRTTIDVKLSSVTAALNQLVVTGVSTVKKKNLVQGISSVNNQQLEKSPAVNLGNALTGKLTGVTTRQRTGIPGGSAPHIDIRGVSTFGNNDPLYIVDGVKQSSFDALRANPENVESITVLKDAAATAIYGIEGANGVILIKTKEGKKGPSKITANFSQGFQVPTLLPEYVGSYRYATLYDKTQEYEQLYENGGDMNKVNASQFKYSPEAINAFKTGKYPLIYPNMDWVHYLTKKFAPQTNAGMTFSGGSDKATYYIAADYLKQGGILKTFGQTYNFNPSFTQYNVRANLTVHVTPTTKLVVKSNGRIGNIIRRRDANLGGNSDFENIYRGSPYGGAGVVDGKVITTGKNTINIPGNRLDPLYSYYGDGYNSYTRDVLNFQLRAVQNLDFLTKGLSLTFMGNYFSLFQENKLRSANLVYYSAFFKTDVDPSAPGDSSIVLRKYGTGGPTAGSEGFSKAKNWLVQARIDYKHDFGPHSVSVVALGKQRRTYYPTTDKGVPLVDQGIPLSLVGFAGQVNYRYKDRYILEGDFAYNGSENFAKGHRFGFFPSISAGWIVSDEPFMKNVHFISFLKLKGSYGLVGNDHQGTGRFLYKPASYPTDNPGGYSFGNQVPQEAPYTYEGKLGNPLVHWETAYKQNYGIDVHFVQNNLALSFTYYKQHRTNILTTLSTVPAYVAASLPEVNVGVVDNHGYEAKAHWKQEVTHNFGYSFGAHVTYSKNKQTYIDEVHRNFPYERRTGKPVGQHFGYIFDGYITKADMKPNSGLPQYPYDIVPGFLKFKDLNGDGVINTDDQRAIGYPEYPEYVFGGTLGFHYKNLHVSTVWNAAAMVSRLLTFSPYRVGFGVGGQGWWGLQKWIADGSWKAWQSPEQNAKSTFPRLYTKIGQLRNSTSANYWMRPARYVRLKNVDIDYTLSPKLLKNIGVDRLMIYAQGYNLLMFSPILKYNIDPETSGISNGLLYPINKVYQIGFKVTF